MNVNVLSGGRSGILIGVRDTLAKGLVDETHVSLQHMSGPILEDWVEEYAGVSGKKRTIH